ncbi:MAG: CHAD domain-containing protein [Gemmatimonadaceae bacterium]|nr:CHAD domain-containing protein [Gemmatimonadaceae bacterium]
MAAFPATILDDDDARAVRLVALALLSDAAAQRERLSQPDDPEALHDFRVAVRRLRSWLRAHEETLGRSAPARAAKWLRRLASATNQARDAEVFAEWLAGEKASLTERQRSGATWLLKRLEALGAAADAEVMSEVARDFERARELLEERLPHFRLRMHVHDGARVTTFAAAMAMMLRSHAASLRRRLEAVRSVHDDEAAHRARIAGKRLRYLLEPIVPHVPGGSDVLARLKRLQDALGDFHDAHAWQLVVADAVERAAREEARALASRMPDEDDALEGGKPARARAASRSRNPRPGMMAIIAHIQERARTTFDAVERDWIGAPAAQLLDGVEAIARALDERARSGLEIERKYLLRGMPHPMPEATVKEIEQGYLPGERLLERVRRVRVRVGESERYFRTVKLGTGLVRTEIEEECGRDVFDVLWPLTEGKRVRKRRHVVADGALNWEVDEFTDRELVLAEIELPAAGITTEFPAWLMAHVERDVTDDPAYVNANLAC